MIHIPGEYFDRFFDPLVGNQDAIDGLKVSLTDHVTGCPDSDDAYVRLQEGANAVVGQAIAGCREQYPKTGIKESLRWGSIDGNGRLGVKLTVTALRAVGDIYEDTATVPQQEANVIANTDRTLRYIFGLAFTGKFVGSMNMEALRHGYDPRDNRLLPLIFAKFIVNAGGKMDFHRALTGTTDTASGQVDIQPRYQKRSKIADRQCPATYARSITESNSKSPLLTFMRTIGDVATAEIFPRHFSVVAHDGLHK